MTRRSLALAAVILLGCNTRKPEPEGNPTERQEAAFILERIAYSVEKAAACALGNPRPDDAEEEAFSAAHVLKSAVHSFVRGNYSALQANKDAALEDAARACHGVPPDRLPQDWN